MLFRFCGDRYKVLEIFVLLHKPMLKKSREALELGIAIFYGTAVSVCEHGHGGGFSFLVATYVPKCGFYRWINWILVESENECIFVEFALSSKLAIPKP